jgi:hypothetical protein
MNFFEMFAPNKNRSKQKNICIKTLTPKAALKYASESDQATIGDIISLMNQPSNSLEHRLRLIEILLIRFSGADVIKPSTMEDWETAWYDDAAALGSNMARYNDMHPAGGTEASRNLESAAVKFCRELKGDT